MLLKEQRPWYVFKLRKLILYRLYLLRFLPPHCLSCGYRHHPRNECIHVLQHHLHALLWPVRPPATFDPVTPGSLSLQSVYNSTQAEALSGLLKRCLVRYNEEKEREEPLGLVNVHNSCTGTKVNWSSHINTHSCRFGGGDLLDEGDSVLVQVYWSLQHDSLLFEDFFRLRLWREHMVSSDKMHSVVCDCVCLHAQDSLLLSLDPFVWNQKVTSLHLRETCQDTHKSAINILKQWNNICMWITDFI